MSVFRYFRKMQTIDNLIRRKATGNQVDFARKLRMSRSLLNIYLNEMKELGFPITYCRTRSTYYYSEEGRMVKSLFESSINREEMKKYTGGQVLASEELPEMEITFCWQASSFILQQINNV